MVNLLRGSAPHPSAGLSGDASRVRALYCAIVTDAPDPAYELLRRELVRAQARLKRAERERDQARAEAARLRDQLRAHGLTPADGAPDESD
jgi:hypothetical protein